MDESHLPFHLGEAGTDGDLRFGGHDALPVFHLQSVGDATGLQFTEHHPRGALVDERGLNAAMQRVYPTLVVGLRFPEADDVVAILVELHFHAQRVIGAAAKAVVSLFVYPVILNLSHILSVLFIGFTSLLCPCGPHPFLHRLCKNSIFS